MINLQFDELVKAMLKSWFHVETVINHVEQHKADVFRYVRENHRHHLAEFILRNDRFFQITPDEAGLFATARTDAVLLSHNELVQALKDAYRIGFEDSLYHRPLMPPLMPPLSEDGKKC